jgi:hypothetical protein
LEGGKCGGGREGDAILTREGLVDVEVPCVFFEFGGGEERRGVDEFRSHGCGVREFYVRMSRYHAPSVGDVVCFARRLRMKVVETMKEEER